jgi:hypothetical protein
MATTGMHPFTARVAGMTARDGGTPTVGTIGKANGTVTSVTNTVMPDKTPL